MPCTCKKDDFDYSLEFWDFYNEQIKKDIRITLEGIKFSWRVSKAFDKEKERLKDVNVLNYC